MTEPENKDNEYLRDVRIEADALDIEWVNQSRLFVKWAERKAKAEDKIKICKEKIKIVDAQIAKTVRARPDVKITDSYIKEEIELDTRHQEALKQLNDACFETDMMDVAVQGMNHKKTALENLVRLFQGSYFSGPREPLNIMRDPYGKKDKENQKDRDETRKRVSKKVVDTSGAETKQ